MPSSFPLPAPITAGKSVDAFTLIEIMVVMLLISIVLAVAVPRFDSGIFQDARKVTTRRIGNTVRNLRTNAVAEQKTYALVMDIDRNRFWVIDEFMDEPAMDQAAEQAFQLPDDIHFVNVIFPQRDPVRSGMVEIQFYAAGYGDQAMIHLQTKQDHRLTIKVEPLLPKTSVAQEWLYY